MNTSPHLYLASSLARHASLAALVLTLAAGLSACDEQEPTGPGGPTSPASAPSTPAADGGMPGSAAPASASAGIPAIGDNDLVAIKKGATASGSTELHSLSRNSLFQSFDLQTPTALHPTDGLFAFAVADWDDDDPTWFRLDLVGIKKANTGSGHTEVHVLSGKDNYSKFLHQLPTALPETGANYEFALADWNNDHSYDLIAVKKSSTGTGRTEVHILSGATGFKTYLLQTGTALHTTDVSWTFQVADWDGRGTPDLIGIKRSGTGSGRTEVHILSGESNFQQFVLQVATPIEETMFNWSFLVTRWDNDYVPDLIAVKQANTGTGKTEVHVLSGASKFQQFLMQTGTALGPTGANWAFATPVPRIHAQIN
jgi:hypothetical protein